MQNGTTRLLLMGTSRIRLLCQDSIHCRDISAIIIGVRTNLYPVSRRVGVPTRAVQIFVKQIMRGITRTMEIWSAKNAAPKRVKMCIFATLWRKERLSTATWGITWGMKDKTMIPIYFTSNIFDDLLNTFLKSRQAQLIIQLILDVARSLLFIQSWHTTKHNQMLVQVTVSFALNSGGPWFDPDRWRVGSM